MDTFFETELPRRLTDLRDAAPTVPSTSQARQKRLAKMETELIACGDFIADVDRYVEMLEGEDEMAGSSPDVAIMVFRYLASLRAQAVTNGRRMRADLATLRRHS